MARLPPRGRGADSAVPSPTLTAPRLPAKGRCILIEWLDIHSHVGWCTAEEPLGVAVCRSVGFVTQADAESITIAATRGVSVGNETVIHSVEVNMRQCIPLGAVKSWEYLQRGHAPVKP